jgi:hypothetical protein
MIHAGGTTINGTQHAHLPFGLPTTKGDHY